MCNLPWHTTRPLAPCLIYYACPFGVLLLNNFFFFFKLRHKIKWKVSLAWGKARWYCKWPPVSKAGFTLQSGPNDLIPFFFSSWAVQIRCLTLKFHKVHMWCISATKQQQSSLCMLPLTEAAVCFYFVTAPVIWRPLQQIRKASILARCRSTTEKFGTEQIVRDRNLGTETKWSTRLIF